VVNEGTLNVLKVQLALQTLPNEKVVVRPLSYSLYLAGYLVFKNRENLPRYVTFAVEQQRLKGE
jgi:hypothetical protein